MMNGKVIYDGKRYDLITLGQLEVKSHICPQNKDHEGVEDGLLYHINPIIYQNAENMQISFVTKDLDFSLKVLKAYEGLLINCRDEKMFSNACKYFETVKEQIIKVSNYIPMQEQSVTSSLVVWDLRIMLLSIKFRKYEVMNNLKSIKSRPDDIQLFETVQKDISNMKLGIYQAIDIVKEVIDKVIDTQNYIARVRQKLQDSLSGNIQDHSEKVSEFDSYLSELESDINDKKLKNYEEKVKWEDWELHQIHNHIPQSKDFVLNGGLVKDDYWIIVDDKTRYILSLGEYLSNKGRELNIENVTIHIAKHAKYTFDFRSLIFKNSKQLRITGESTFLARKTILGDILSENTIPSVVFKDVTININQDFPVFFNWLRNVEEISFYNCTFSSNRFGDPIEIDPCKTTKITLHNIKHWFATFDEFMTEFSIDLFPKSVQKISITAKERNVELVRE